MSFAGRNPAGVHRPAGHADRRAQSGPSDDQTSQHRLAHDRPRRRPGRAGENLRQPLRLPCAWKYVEAHKDKYGLSKITKPQSAHFAYSIYFHEPGGNHLEIEYYNPGGALHGRAHTAGHWDNPLNSERFAGRGYVPQAFTHGTLQCDAIERSRRFYVEVLGLEIAAGFNTAQYIKHP